MLEDDDDDTFESAEDYALFGPEDRVAAIFWAAMLVAWISWCVLT